VNQACQDSNHIPPSGQQTAAAATECDLTTTRQHGVAANWNTDYHLLSSIMRRSRESVGAKPAAKTQSLELRVIWIVSYIFELLQYL
jgi:hypothetical protein